MVFDPLGQIFNQNYVLILITHVSFRDFLIDSQEIDFLQILCPSGPARVSLVPTGTQFYINFVNFIDFIVFVTQRCCVILIHIVLFRYTSRHSRHQILQIC